MPRNITDDAPLAAAVRRPPPPPPFGQCREHVGRVDVRFAGSGHAMPNRVQRVSACALRCGRTWPRVSCLTIRPVRTSHTGGRVARADVFTPLTRRKGCNRVSCGGDQTCRPPGRLCACEGVRGCAHQRSCRPTSHCKCTAGPSWPPVKTWRGSECASPGARCRSELTCPLAAVAALWAQPAPAPRIAAPASVVCRSGEPGERMRARGGRPWAAAPALPFGCT